MPFVRDMIDRDLRDSNLGERLRALNGIGKPLRLTRELLDEVYSAESVRRRTLDQRRREAEALGRIRHWVIM